MAARTTTIAVTVLILVSSNISDEHVLPNLQRNTNAHQTLKIFHKDEMKVKELNNVQCNIDIHMDEDIKEEHDDKSMLNANSKSNEETVETNAKKQVSIDSSNMKLNRLRNDLLKHYIDLHIDLLKGNSDKLKLNAIPKSNAEILKTNAKKLIIDNFNSKYNSRMLPRDSVERIKEIFSVASDDRLIKADSSMLVADDLKTLKTNGVNTLERVKRDSNADDIVIWDYCAGKTRLEYIDGKFECVEVTFETRSSIGTLAKCPSDTRRVILNNRVVFCRPKRRR